LSKHTFSIGVVNDVDVSDLHWVMIVYEI